MREVKLKDLKKKTPTELLVFAEEQEVENASIMRKQELMFAILKQLASREVEIIGEGVVELDALCAATGAGITCGSCRPELKRILASHSAKETQHAA